MTWRDDDDLTDDEVDEYEWMESAALDAAVDRIREEGRFDGT